MAAANAWFARIEFNPASPHFQEMSAAAVLFLAINVWTLRDSQAREKVRREADQIARKFKIQIVEGLMVSVPDKDQMVRCRGGERSCNQG